MRRITQARPRTHGVALVLAVLVLSVALRSAAVAAEPADTPAFRAAPLASAAGPTNLGLPLFGLFDRSRLTWNQSLSFGYSSGGAFGSGTSGLYTSSFGYRIANPLNLHVDIGANLNPSYGPMGRNSAGVFLQGLSLDWRPFANSVIRFQYENYRSPLQWRSAYSPYYGRYAPLGADAAEPPSRN